MSKFGIEVRQQAKALYQERGATVVAETLCISLKTVHRWAKAESWPAPGTEARRQQRTEAAKLGWQRLRLRLRDRCGQTAFWALDQIDQRLTQADETGRPIPLRDLVQLVAVALEKAQKLSDRDAETGSMWVTNPDGHLNYSQLPALGDVLRAALDPDTLDRIDLNGGNGDRSDS
jgi:hypothetical protein